MPTPVFVGLALSLGLAWLPAAERIPLSSLGNPEAALLADAADGRLDQHSLLRAALVAGGASSDQQLRASEERLLASWREIDGRQLARLAPRERAQLVLSAMHRLLLTGHYAPDCTELHRTLASGDYNCVTASVLYLELGRRHGLTGNAVAVPGHVYCRTSLEQPLDIQTTCRDWFDILHGRVVSPETQELLKSVREKQSQARSLSDVALVGKVYYNRGVTALEQRDYAEAIRLLETGLQLDPLDAPAKSNLIAAWNNWALELCDAGEFSAALLKLEAGRKIDAQYGPLLTNDLHIHQKWALHLCEQGQHHAALELLEKGHARRPDAPLFDAGRFAVIGMWMTSLGEAAEIARLNSVLASTRERYGNHIELERQAIAALEKTISGHLSAGRTQVAGELLSIANRYHPTATAMRSLSARLTASPLP